MEGPTGFRSLLASLCELKKCTIIEKEIRFENGSKIYLNHCQHDKDVYGYQGAEIHVLGIEEATQFSEFQVRYLRSRMRIPDTLNIPIALKGVFPRALYTSNPGGVGHSYFKRAFVDACAPMTLFTAPLDDAGLLRQFIPARLADNPSVNPEEYAKRLKGLGSEQYVKALLNGDWDAIVGAYYDCFDRTKHVKPDFNPPKHWFKFRSFDWGGSAPFAVLWWCVSDGQEFKTVSGETLNLPRGSLICYREWYGCSAFKSSEGLGMRNEDIAAGIIERTKESNISGTVTDSLPFQDRGGITIAEIFRKQGVPLIHGDTSRVTGWSQLRSGLLGSEGKPSIYFVESCLHLIRTLPAMQRSNRNPEDIADGQEDHAPDAARLAAMARRLIVDSATAPKDYIEPEKPRVNEVLKKHFARQNNESTRY